MAKDITNSSQEDGADLGFETELWRTADLRSNMGVCSNIDRSALPRDVS